MRSLKWTGHRFANFAKIISEFLRRNRNFSSLVTVIIFKYEKRSGKDPNVSFEPNFDKGKWEIFPDLFLKALDILIFIFNFSVFRAKYFWHYFYFEIKIDIPVFYSHRKHLFKYRTVTHNVKLRFDAYQSGYLVSNL